MSPSMEALAFSMLSSCHAYGCVRQGKKTQGDGGHQGEKHQAGNHRQEIPLLQGVQIQALP